jgi:hypothetical protein
MNVEKRLMDLNTPTPSHEVSQSKWGFYPCCWQTYQKLRVLNFLGLLCLRQEAAYERWARKLPGNRVIRKQGKVLLEKPIPIPEPKSPALFNIGAEKKDQWKVGNSYRTAKYPKATAAEVEKLDISPARIDELLSLARQRLGLETAEDAKVA